MRRIRILFSFAILILTGFIFSPARAHGQEISFEVSHSIDWAKGELNAAVSYSLAEAGIRLPAGRFMGEEILENAYPRLLRPFLLPVKTDSSSTISNLLERGELSLEELNRLVSGAEKTPPSLSGDLTRMTGRYTLLLEKLSVLLSRQRRAVEPGRPLIPAATADYSGLIIIADEELPVHGRRSRALAEPCLFPKIWDSNMNLVYEKNMFEPGSLISANGGRRVNNFMVCYTPAENIFRPTPSGLEGELAALVGPYPLRVFAREVFGIFPTDLVIDRDDALKILSSDNNRRLLREGRVVFVLNESVLR